MEIVEEGKNKGKTSKHMLVGEVDERQGKQTQIWERNPRWNYMENLGKPDPKHMMGNIRK